jgi:hypothetical protein
MNLLDTITLFGTAVLAAPIGLLGVEFLLRGRPIVGGGFLAVAVGLVAGSHFKPSLKGMIADTVVDTVVEEPDGETRSRDRDRDGETYKD